MDSGAACRAALQKIVSVRFWAPAWMQLACQLIISFITGQKTSHRLKPPLCEGEEHFMSVFHFMELSPRRQNVECWNFSRSTTNIIRARLANPAIPLAVWTYLGGPLILVLTVK